MHGNFVVRKLAQAVITIAMIVIVNFLLFRMMPGSPERALLRSPHISAEVLAEKRQQWGLDKPLILAVVIAAAVVVLGGVLVARRRSAAGEEE